MRQAYFTGADEPYDKPKRALRAEIDEEAWAALYSTKSIPFDIPETWKIAVKVILDEWVRAINEHGGFGVWQWAVSNDPADVTGIPQLIDDAVGWGWKTFAALVPS